MTEHELWVKTHSLDKVTGVNAYKRWGHIQVARLARNEQGLPTLTTGSPLSTPALAPSVHENTQLSSFTSLVTTLPSFPL